MKSKEKKRDVPLLTKAEEDAVIARAVRGEAAAMAEMTARYRGLITAESHASYLRGSALAAEAENVAVLAFIEALHDYDAAYGPPFAGFVKARVHHALIAEFRRELRRRARTCAPQEDAAGHETWAACGTVCPTERADERLLAEDILTRAMHRLTERPLRQILPVTDPRRERDERRRKPVFRCPQHQLLCRRRDGVPAHNAEIICLQDPLHRPTDNGIVPEPLFDLLPEFHEACLRRLCAVCKPLHLRKRSKIR